MDIKTDLKENGTAGVMKDERGHLVQFFEEENDAQREYWFNEDLSYRLERIIGKNAHFIRQISNIAPPIHPWNVGRFAPRQDVSRYDPCGAYILSSNTLRIPPDSDSSLFTDNASFVKPHESSIPTP